MAGPAATQPSRIEDPAERILRSFPRLNVGRLLTINELSEVTNLKDESIVRRLSTGASLPAVTRIGRRPMFAPADVVAWLVEAREARA